VSHKEVIDAKDTGSVLRVIVLSSPTLSTPLHAHHLPLDQGYLVVPDVQVKSDVLRFVLVHEFARVWKEESRSGAGSEIGWGRRDDLVPLVTF
jgi:hypothetical protein